MRQISYPNGSIPTTHLLLGMIRRLAAWRPRHVLRAMLLIAFAALLSAPCVHAGIIVTDDVDPSDPSDWVISDIIKTEVFIGNTSYGSVTLDDGSTVRVSHTYLGNETGSAGTLTLKGEGTTWTCYESALRVGAYGTGTLKITNGASVSSGLGYIGRYGSGTVIIDGEGSTWTIPNGYFYAGYKGTGTLKITNGASMLAAAGIIGRSSAGNGTVIVDGEGSTWTNSKSLCVGMRATGTLKIANGASVSNTDGYIGRDSGASGTVIVDGEGSTWTNSGDLYVGRTGAGTLNITNGASASNTDGYAGRDPGAGGTAIVDGEGSTWTNSGNLYIGLGLDEAPGGTGTVSISDGGAVSASAVSIGGSSILTTDLGYGSSLTVGSGSGDITNNGTLRLVAGAGAASGTYTPMSYGTLLGNDAQALGGVWDSDSHTVTVKDAEVALAGRAKTIDLATTQRLLFVDAPTGRIAGAGFMASDSPLKFTASVMGESEVSALESILGPSGTVLSAWDFLAKGGYTEGDPVYLSLEVGSGYDLSVLALWYYDESTWSEFLASDLAYDNTYASFTVTDFSGYAVTGTSSVPIPAAVWLLGSGLLGLIGIRKKRH